MALVLLMLAALQVIVAGAPPRMFLLQTSQAHSHELRAFGNAFATPEAAEKDHNSSTLKKLPVAGNLSSVLSPYAQNKTAEAGPAALALAAMAPYIQKGDEALTTAEFAFLAFTSDVSKKKGKFGIFACGVFLGALLCGGVPLFMQACARSVRKAIEDGVERSESTIGIDARIGKVSVHLCEGYIAVHGLTVLNPKGYDSEYLLRVKKVHIDLHTFTLVSSSFKQILVERMIFKGVDIWYNKAARSSNINDVLSLDPGDASGDRALFGGKAAAAGGKTSAATSSDAERGGPAQGGAKVTLKEVRVEDVGMRMEHQMFQGMALRTEMADISYTDFESDAKTGDCCAHAVALRLMQGVLRSITKTAGSVQRSKRQGT